MSTHGLECGGRMELQGKTILIVEDDPGTQLLLATLMRRMGFEASVTSNGAQAIEMLKQRGFDVVILDLMMPAVSGQDVISFLGDQHRGERVVVCTAAGPRTSAGIDMRVVKAIVRKPFDIDQLTSTVTAVLEDDA
jgi:DNA-binding NtrC family response regulator